MSKAFSVLTGIIIAIFIVIFGFVIYMMVAISEDPPGNSQYIPEPENLSVNYQILSTDILDAGIVNLENYVNVNTLDFNGKSFAEHNHGMSEKYYFYNRYYIDNIACQELCDEINRYFYGTDYENPDFIFEVSENYEKNEWFVAKGYNSLQ